MSAVGEAGTTILRDTIASAIRSAESLVRAVRAAAQAWQGPMSAYRDAPVVLTNVRIVDLDAERADERPSDIEIERGRISKIAPAGEMDSRGRKAVAGQNRFALPGLIDCHIHVSGILITEPPGVADFGWMVRQIFLNHRVQIQSGVTLVRDMMSVLRASLLLRSVAEDPCSGFPRVLCAGPMLTVAGGYPPYIPGDQLCQRILGGPLKLELRDERDAVAWVDRLADAGVDWVKVGYQSALFDVARTPMQKPSPELFRAIVDRAHRRGLPVAVHHYWIEDLKKLLDLPFDTLEHITEDGEIDARTIERLAERSLPVTTDLEQSAFTHEPEKFLKKIADGTDHLLPRPRRDIARLLEDVAAGRDIYALKPRRKMMDLAFVKDFVLQKERNAKRLSDAGILLGAGSDSGVHMMMGILPDELCRMAGAGIANAKVLRSATADAAKLLRVPDVGRLKPGYRADIVLYDENPLEHMASIRKPALVMRDGVPQTATASPTPA